MPTNGKPGANGRFELSFTPINFSLTDGTNIPPPPASPIEEKASPIPPAAPPKPQASGADVVQNGSQQRDRTASGTSIPPLNLVSQKRPSSIRRFVSRMSLNQNYVDNGSQEDPHRVSRPPSQASVMTMDRSLGLKSKRSNNWFKRFSTSSLPTQTQTSRQSHVSQQPGTDRKPIVRAQPPRLPDKYMLKSQIPEGDEGSLGGEDMFKNIR